MTTTGTVRMTDDSVLKIWSYEEAPEQYAALFSHPDFPSWIAYVPHSLEGTPAIQSLFSHALRIPLQQGGAVYLGRLLPDSE